MVSRELLTKNVLFESMSINRRDAEFVLEA